MLATRTRIAGLAPLAVAVAATLAPGSARAVSETFSDFSSTAGLTLSGDAAAVTTLDGPVLRLTSATGSQRGSVFSSETVDLRTFSTAFAFRLTAPGGVSDPADGQGGDGLAFVVQSVSASLGGLGSGLGIEGVSPSVAVEFDTWRNPDPNVEDPSSNHIGVDVDGNIMSVITAEVSPKMNDGKVWYVWIDYDGACLTIRLGESSLRPADPLLTAAIDIPGTLGVTRAYVGFSAATAAAWQNHDILRWEYEDPYVEGGAGPDSSVGAELDGGAADAIDWDGSPTEMPSRDAGGDAVGDGIDGGPADGAPATSSDAESEASVDGGLTDGPPADLATMEVDAKAPMSGCSCDAAPGPGPSLWFGLALLPLLTRGRTRARRAARAPRANGRASRPR